MAVGAWEPEEDQDYDSDPCPAPGVPDADNRETGMTGSRSQITVLSVIGGIHLCAWTTAASADSLEAHVSKRSFLLYEPVPILVDLSYDDPVVVNFAENIEEAEKQLRRIPIRLNVTLRDEEGKEASQSLLFNAKFTRPERGDPVSTFAAGGLAFFDILKLAKGGMWTVEPGQYTLTVSGARLESRAISVEFRNPQGEELEASRVFAASFPGGIGIILAQEDKDGVIGSFQELARDYPETIYGKYALASLALMQYRETFAEHNNNGGAPVWSPVVEQLRAASQLLEASHPLRQKALFKLASAQVCAGSDDDAANTLEALRQEAPYGETGLDAARMLEGIERRRSEAQSQPDDPDPSTEGDGTGD